MKKIGMIALILISGVTMAQKTKVLAGSFENLKGITEYNVVHDYGGLKVDMFESEEAYLTGTEQFAPNRKEWAASKLEFFEPKFIESFNKRFEGKIKADKNLANANILS